MTNGLALILGLFFTSLIVLDLTLNDGDSLIFLGRKGLDMMAYMAFWR